MAVSPITNRVRELRAQQGELTQQALAEQCKVTRQTIIALETGRYAPSLELAFRISKALNTPLTDVFHWDEVGK